jgi:protein involved in polysaccharide export with SLBB domain
MRYPQTTNLDNRSRLQMLMPSYPIPPDMHPVIRHRPNPYADVPLLYDLYTQVSKRSPVLERFGADIFENGTGNFDELPMDMPVGPEYVLGPGDGLSIELWGGVSQRLQRVVDREGRVALPESGAVQVSGKTLGAVQNMVQATLREQFRDVQADVSLARLRSVRVYVVGDVVRPGAYDISSLSTPLNALYLAGGPTSQGSLRRLEHYRGKERVEQVDVYDLLLHGVRDGVQHLEAGDTILVPPIGPEVTVEGMVRRPAIYELNSEASLAEILELSGGVLNTGTLRHIEVERVQAHESRTMLRLDVPETNNQEAVTQAIEDFKIQDGDKVRISPIFAGNEKTVYLDGHVFHPGKYAYSDGMRVSDLIKSYNELLPEPSRRHAEIIRLNAPDYAPEVLTFNLEDALAGHEQDVALKPYDTVRVFGRYDFEDAPVITVGGEVRDPGDHVTNGATHLRDAIYLAGGVTAEAQLDDAQIFRRTQDGKLKVLSVNLKRALAGEGADDVLLESKDRVFVHRNLGKSDPATVKIEGEVERPGKYPLGDEMTAAELVRLAGGLKRGAYTEAADLTRYTVAENSNVMGEHSSVPIGRALAGEPDTDVRLHDGDVLTIRELSGWQDIGSVITVSGEVMHPGGYGIQEKERLSSVLQRAGGLRADAYPYGAILVRAQVRDLEEKTRADLIRKVQAEESSFKLTPDSGDPDDKLAKDAELLQWRDTLDQLKSTPPAGRLVIHISKDLRKWANTPADIEVRAGDSLFIPKTPNAVTVNGQVYNPTAVAYRPGRSAGWYLGQAGGPTSMANKKAIIVIRADGSVAGSKDGWFSGNALSAELRPGDMVFVPEKALGGGISWRNLSLGAQLASSIAIAAEVAHSF